MIRSFIRSADGKCTRGDSVDAVRDALKDSTKHVWLDMQACDEAEVTSVLRDIFRIHPLAIEDAIHSLQRPKVESFQYPEHNPEKADYYYIVVHAPDLESFKIHECHEIDCFLGERFLVTVHDQPVKSIDDRFTKGDSDPTLVLNGGADVLLYTILDHIVDQYQPILDDLSDALEELDEEAASDNPPRDLPKRISDKKRLLLYLRQIAGPQREVLAQLTRGEVPFIRESTRIYLRDVLDHLTRVYETVELYRDIVMGARDIYLSSISNHLNQIMKTLTIISVIGLPLTIVTGFFGMNFDAIPGLHSPVGFWSAVVGMGIAVTGMLYLFKKKRWI